MPLPMFNLHQIVPAVECDRESAGVSNRTFPYQGVLVPGDEDDGLIVVVQHETGAERVLFGAGRYGKLFVGGGQLLPFDDADLTVGDDFPTVGMCRERLDSGTSQGSLTRNLKLSGGWVVSALMICQMSSRNVGTASTFTRFCSQSQTQSISTDSIRK